MIRGTWSISLAFLALMMGCQAPERDRSGMQQRAISDIDTDAVMAEALVILKREFGRARVVANGRSIETAAVEYTTDKESGRARDLVGGRSTMRRKAVFTVGQRGETVIARLRVEVERRDTESESVFSPSSARFGDDSPGQQSAVDRDAATTTEQNVVWTPVRRDLQLERALLGELQERFTRLAADRDAMAAAATQPTAAATQPAERPNSSEGTPE